MQLIFEIVEKKNLQENRTSNDFGQLPLWNFSMQFAYVYVVVVLNANGCDMKSIPYSYKHILGKL